MSIVDYLIVLIPLALVMGLGWYSRRYIRGVVDYLSAGRLCGRYLLTVGDMINGFSILAVISYIEKRYRVGYGVVFWWNLMIPVSIMLALTGYCVYRFRETKALSGGQLIEMRYGSRALRFYVSFVRTLAEMLAHSIMPALAARFFMYFFALPEYFTLFGISFSTFVWLMVFCMTLAIALICFGGTLTIVITDTLQGLISMPIMFLMTVFLLLNFNIGTQILPVMLDRIPGESFINCFDVAEVRDFNLFSILVSLFSTFLNRANWLGSGTTGAAKTAHEQKMASMLGTWRNSLAGLLYIMLTVTLLVTLNHRDFAKTAREIRTDLAQTVACDIVKDPALQTRLCTAFAAIPEQVHVIGRDKPLSDRQNLETVYIQTARRILDADPATRGKSQEFRTLYHQQMAAVSMRHILCTGLLGLFALLMVLAMLSTDDSYIFNSSITIAQDLILPFFKKPPSPQLHIRIIRLTTIGVGVFFLICSIGITQMEYVDLFRATVLPLYLGGCGPVMIFALYGRFGTKQGAWTSMLVGTGLSLLFMFFQRNWGSLIYPWLEVNGYVPAVANALDTLCTPFKPYIRWTMNPYKCPVNPIECGFITTMTTLVLYIAVSFATLKEPFNLDRMLHRGIYNTDGTAKPAPVWNLKHICDFFTGITPQHTLGDRIIARCLLVYSYGYQFFGMFILVILWNWYHAWGPQGWGRYFAACYLYIPLFTVLVTVIWFWIGGIRDMRNLFRDLKARTVNNLDNGMVQDGVSIADVAKFSKLEKKDRPEK